MKCAVIGLGQFGSALALELSRAGHEVSAIDDQAAHIDAVRDHVTFAARADATDPEALAQLGMADMDIVVVAIGEDFEASLMTTTRLLKLGVQRLHVRVVNDVHEHLLDLLGIERKIKAEQMAALSLARVLAHRCFTRHFPLDPLHAIVETTLPASWVGKSVRECGLRSRHAINLVMVRRPLAGAREDDAPGLGVPTPDFCFQRHDRLVLFGTEESLHTFAAYATASGADEGEP